MNTYTLKTHHYALIIIILWICMVLVSHLFSHNATQIDMEKILLPPVESWTFGWQGILGYDELGRSILERLLLGAKTSFLVAIGVVTFSAFIGISIGLYSGYKGGLVDSIVVKVIDVFLAFPGLLLAIALAAIMGPGIENVIFALVTVGWVSYARLARAQTLSVKNKEHILSAKTFGISKFMILWRHILPLIFAPLGVEITFGIAGAIISEAGLSFLGLGVQAPSASWGSMIREGTRYLLVAPYLVLAPGISLMLVVLAVNILGDYWRDKLDVRSDK